MYCAWPAKAPVSNEFWPSQTLKKGTIAISELGEDNKVEKNLK